MASGEKFKTSGIVPSVTDSVGITVLVQDVKVPGQPDTKAVLLELSLPSNALAVLLTPEAAGQLGSKLVGFANGIIGPAPVQPAPEPAPDPVAEGEHLS